MNKCIGCGDVIKDSNKLCPRCFKIVNYGEYEKVIKKNSDFKEILKNISKTKDLTLLVFDVLNIGNLEDIIDLLNDRVILVLTKRDLLPKSLFENKIINYLDNPKFIAKIMVSSKNNYNIDNLYNLINKYKTNNIYVVGYTNAGKSSLINKLIYNYSDLDYSITTSFIPTTTIDTIKIKLNDFTLIDTPGLIDDGSIINYLDPSDLKKITPQKTIKPITYQIKNKQYIYIEDFLIIEVLDPTNLTIFMANGLKINRFYKDKGFNNLTCHKLEVDLKNDIVIKGLGFIKISKKCQINIYTIEKVDVYLRKSLI